MIRGSKVDNNSIEIFGNSDQPSRSGSFISAETFKKCLEKSAPVPITVNGEEIGKIVMREATLEERESIANYINSISEPLYTRDDMIKRLEKIRREIDDCEHFKYEGDYWSITVWDVRNIIDKNIAEIKGESNEKHE
jgi:uncharacterized membrane-anchored protein YjiN (DUF445 family)